MNLRKTGITVVLALMAASAAFSQTVWEKYAGNPVVKPVAEWESYGNINVTIIKVGDVYKLWYTGLSSRRRIGMATSVDGIHWTKSNANPVLDVGMPGDFDSEHVYTPMVMYHNDYYWMWYAGHNGITWQIGLATSQDGVHWTKYSNNPVLKIGNPGAWDDKEVASPFVMDDGSVFKMWYRGESKASPGKGSTGYAESADGIHWEKYGENPIFGPMLGAWDSRSLTIYPIVKRNGKYEGWYAATGDGSVSQLGYVTSVDGIHWERYPNNPILSPPYDNSWESGGISSPFVLFEKNLYKLWYAGNGPNGWAIGYATSTPLPPVERFVFLPRVYGFPGDTINVSLYADPIAGISGVDAEVRFDPEVLHVTGVHTTDFTKSFLVAANLDTPGVARISLAGATSAIGGLGGLVTIRMVVNPSLAISDTTFSRPLKLVLASLYDEDGQLLPATKRDGVFVLGSSRGDVNGDGFINAADAILTLRIAAGLLQPTPEQFVAADFDGNGHVESFDASCILRRAVGLDCPIGGNSTVAANLEITPFSTGAGDQVETQIAIHGIDKLLSGDVTLRYDETALEITEIRPGSEMSEVAFVSNLNNSGRAQFSFAANNGFAANTIAVIRLRTKTGIDERHLRSVEAIFFDGQGRRWNGVVTKVYEPESALPSKFRLEQNYPNPFYRQQASASVTSHLAGRNFTETQIRYSLSQRQHVRLAIYDLHGRLVRLLEDTEKPAGEFIQKWDGRDQHGALVASGVYMYRLQVEQNAVTRKMLVLE